MPSAGTITMTVGAEVGALDAGLRQAEDVVNRFSAATQRSIDAVRRSSEALAGGFRGTDALMGGMSQTADSVRRIEAGAGAAMRAIDQGATRATMSTGTLSRSMGKLAGGILMLGGNAEGASKSVGGVLARSFGAFMVGGPILAGLSLAGDGMEYLGERSRKAAAEVEDAAKRAADAVAEMNSRVEGIRAANRRTEQQGRAKAAGVDVGFLDEKEMLESTVQAKTLELSLKKRALAQLQRNLPSLVEQTDVPGIFSSETDPYKELREKYFGLLKDQLEAESDLNETKKRLADLLAAHERELRTKATDEALKQAREVAEEKDKLLSRYNPLAGRQREQNRERREADAQKADQEASEVRRERDRLENHYLGIANRQREDRRQEQERLAAANEALSDQVALLRAADDAARLQVQHAIEWRNAIRDGTDLGMLLEKQALETSDLLAQQREDAERTAEAEAERVQAHRDMAEEARRRAEFERNAADAASRVNQTNAFGAGYGPLAQARDARKRSSNIERFKNHQANLDAEARMRPIKNGQIGAPQYDEQGNPVGTRYNPDGSIFDLGGAGDPFAFDLGSVVSRWQGPPPAKEAAPGLLMPAYNGPLDPLPTPPAAGGSGGELRGLAAAAGSLSLAGDTTEEAGSDTATSATAVEDAAKKIASGAEDIAEGSGSIADSVGSIGETVGAIAGGVKSMAEAIDEVKGDLEALKATFEAAGYLGGK